MWEHTGSWQIFGISFYRTIEPLAPAILMQKRTGDIVSIAGNNVETLELFFAHTIAPLVTAIVIPVIVFISLFFIHPVVAGVYALLTLCIAFLPKLALSLNDERGNRLRELIGGINSFLIDSVQGIREILAFSRSESRFKQVMSMSDQYQDEYGIYVRKNSIITASFILILSGGVIVMLTISSILATRGEIDPLNLPIIILFTSAGFASMANIVEISKQFSLTFAGAKRLYELMDLTPSVQEPDKPVHPVSLDPSSFGGKTVSFRYNPQESLVLQDISFRVPAGKTVAL
jgi:ABC-type multidrug transport system, ATPase and permease components